MIAALIVTGSATLLAVAIGVGWLRRRYRTVRISGSSMEPALYSGDLALLARTSASRPVRTGQIVVVAQPVHIESGWYWRRSGDQEWTVKRVVATAGEPVPNNLLDAVEGSPGTRVPGGRLLVLGDQPATSIDSREWGYVPVHGVLGVVVRVNSATTAGRPLNAAHDARP